MHRQIVNAPPDKVVDHRDMNSLNNQRNNIRLCSRSHNGLNRLAPRTNTSGYKGVWKEAKRYTAVVIKEGKRHCAVL